MGCSLDGLSFSRCSIVCSYLSFGKEHFSVKIFEMCVWPHQLGTMPIYWKWSLLIVSPLCCVFWLKSSPLGPGSLLLPGVLDFLVATPSCPSSHCYMFLFNFLTLCTSLLPPPLSPQPPLSLPDSSPLSSIATGLPVFNSSTKLHFQTSSCFLTCVCSLSEQLT